MNWQSSVYPRAYMQFCRLAAELVETSDFDLDAAVASFREQMAWQFALEERAQRNCLTVLTQLFAELAANLEAIALPVGSGNGAHQSVQDQLRAAKSIARRLLGRAAKETHPPLPPMKLVLCGEQILAALSTERGRISYSDLNRALFWKVLGGQEKPDLHSAFLSNTLWRDHRGQAKKVEAHLCQAMDEGRVAFDDLESGVRHLNEMLVWHGLKPVLNYDFVASLKHDLDTRSFNWGAEIYGFELL